MQEPTFDPRGYPTDETCEAIRHWTGDFRALLAFVRRAWKYVDEAWAEEPTETFDGSPATLYRISTMGWSGNESLLEALHENREFWICCWVSSRRGGHYEFEVRHDD